jgi:peptide/nickel transport system ATP-binding protein
MSNTPIVQLENLQTYFQTGSGIAKAVDGVRLSINNGETYALVGESGCGKSVTALSILQLVAQPAGYIAGGRILLHGQDISQLPPIAMRSVRGNQVSMIFQEPMTALNPVFTIGNQISEAILLHQKVTKKEARSATISMLEKVGIPDPSERFGEYPHQMSGGMRQRVMIAMALACEPELLIADEPTTALDVTIQSQILELMRDLQKDLGTAVLLITHDMGVVQENADRVGVMYAGKLVEEASKADLFANPTHPYTKLLLRSIPARTKRDMALATITGRVPKATAWPQGCRFADRCPLVMDKCRTEAPPPFDVGNNHKASCFLLEEGNTADTSILDHRHPSPPSALDSSVCRLDATDLEMHFPIRKGLLKRVAGHVKAVDGVSLSIHKGETLALVGESGCGKTTVGKCLVRLYDPSGG